MWNFESSAMIVLDKRIGALEIDSKAERLLREVVHNNMILFKYSGLLKLSFPFYKVTTNIIITYILFKFIGNFSLNEIQHVSVLMLYTL